MPATAAPIPREESAMLDGVNRERRMQGHGPMSIEDFRARHQPAAAPKPVNAAPSPIDLIEAAIQRGEPVDIRPSGEVTISGRSITEPFTRPFTAGHTAPILPAHVSDADADGGRIVTLEPDPMDADFTLPTAESALRVLHNTPGLELNAAPRDAQVIGTLPAGHVVEESDIAALMAADNTRHGLPDPKLTMTAERDPASMPANAPVVDPATALDDDATLTVGASISLPRGVMGEMTVGASDRLSPVYCDRYWRLWRVAQEGAGTVLICILDLRKLAQTPAAGDADKGNTDAR